MIRRPLNLVAALILAITAVTPAAEPAPVAAGGGVLPDLTFAPMTDFRIEVVGGRRLLRFNGFFVNAGAGHFELRGSRGSTSQPMAMSQVIYESTSRSSAIAQQLPTSAVASYAGDGHNHWHVNEVARYDMWSDGVLLRGAKVGFCFLDSDPYNTSLPGHVGSFYTGAMCSTNPNALSNRMGISVGWGDLYQWYLAWQWIDITGVSGGTYTVRAKVDPNGQFTESNETNQCTWARVSFSGSSNAVSVLSSGTGCVNDVDGSIFAVDIYWAFDAGITVGCAPDLYCTANPVTREQMASFLVRAMGLPLTGTDFFTDDAGSVHQSDINSLAAAGIAAGCGGGRFCPTVAVTRQEMASFIARARGLPTTQSDFFFDDETSVHESDINRLAASGITTGCAPGRYCPLDAVTRGEMAAFLHRAFGG